MKTITAVLTAGALFAGSAVPATIPATAGAKSSWRAHKVKPHKVERHGIVVRANRASWR